MGDCLHLPQSGSWLQGHINWDYGLSTLHQILTLAEILPHCVRAGRQLWWTVTYWVTSHNKTGGWSCKLVLKTHKMQRKLTAAHSKRHFFHQTKRIKHFLIQIKNEGYTSLCGVNLRINEPSVRTASIWALGTMNQTTLKFISPK